MVSVCASDLSWRRTGSAGPSSLAESGLSLCGAIHRLHRVAIAGSKLGKSRIAKVASIQAYYPSERSDFKSLYLGSSGETNPWLGSLHWITNFHSCYCS